MEKNEGGDFLKREWKNEIPVALFGGAISGAVCLIGLLFVAPERWYFAFLVALVMAAAVFFKSVSDKKKNTGKYERDEHLIAFPFAYSAEGFLRGDSDRAAKFYFGEEKIAALYYENVKPHIKEFEKNQVKTGYFDRCGWFSIILENEKSRIVIPKGEAEKAADFLEEMLEAK